MRVIIPAMLFLGLCACGSSGEVGGFFTPATLNGSTFSGPAATMVTTGSASDDAYYSTVIIDFPSEGQAVVSFDGFNGPTLFWDADEEAYVDPDGTYALFFTSESDAPDIVTFAVLGNLDTATPFVQMHVNGNLTDPASLPSSGIASFSGDIAAFDGAGNVMEGQIDISMDFQTTFVKGGFSLDGTQVGRAEFTLTESPLSNGQFETSVVSPDMDIFDSHLYGALFGTEGDQVGGEFWVDSTSGSMVGTYTAHQ